MSKLLHLFTWLVFMDIFPVPGVLMCSYKDMVTLNFFKYFRNLIDAGANLITRDEKGQSALHKV